MKICLSEKCKCEDCGNNGLLQDHHKIYKIKLRALTFPFILHNNFYKAERNDTQGFWILYILCQDLKKMRCCL